MVTICQMSEVKYSDYDEVWAIVRSLKYANPHIRHVPELSPSWGLFKLYLRLRDEGRWNEETFRTLYVPQFLKEMRGKEQQQLLNELFSTKKNICLVCFCSEENLCHRSIVGGMLQGAGLEVKGLLQDYSYYFEWYKNGVPGVPENNVNLNTTIEVKHVADYNDNVTYLYKLDNPVLFDDDISTLCFTGRRPKDLCGYDTAKYKEFVTNLADLLYEEFYIRLSVRRFITGGAQGFDQMAFWAVERMIKQHDCYDTQNIVFIPFEGQELRWADSGLFSKAEYWMMIKNADQIVVVSDINDIGSMFTRNHTMCDNADYCLALYPDDSWSHNKGGTSECMRYAVNSRAKLFRLGYMIDNVGLHIGEMSMA